MRRLLPGVAVAVAMSLSSTAQADVLSAMPACYVDTWGWDYLTAYGCTANASPSTTIVTFGVLGIDQSGGRYIIEFLDGTCDQVGNGGHDGYICNRIIYHGQTFSQRMRVYDTWTNQWSSILPASASYYSDN